MTTLTCRAMHVVGVFGKHLCNIVGPNELLLHVFHLLCFLNAHGSLMAHLPARARVDEIKWVGKAYKLSRVFVQVEYC